MRAAGSRHQRLRLSQKQGSSTCGGGQAPCCSNSNARPERPQSCKVGCIHTHNTQGEYETSAQLMQGERNMRGGRNMHATMQGTTAHLQNTPRGNTINARNTGGEAH
eukprot:354799-Pelagomonas_calceolata.AAC.1